MIRRCDGTDPNLIREIPGVRSDTPFDLRYEPCTCGRLFNDVERSTIWPHYKLLTHEQKQAFLDAFDDQSLSTEDVIDLWRRLSQDWEADA